MLTKRNRAEQTCRQRINILIATFTALIIIGLAMVFSGRSGRSESAEDCCRRRLDSVDVRTACKNVNVRDRRAFFSQQFKRSGTIMAKKKSAGEKSPNEGKTMDEARNVSENKVRGSNKKISPSVKETEPLIIPVHAETPLRTVKECLAEAKRQMALVQQRSQMESGLEAQWGGAVTHVSNSKTKEDEISINTATFNMGRPNAENARRMTGELIAELTKDEPDLIVIGLQESTITGSISKKVTHKLKDIVKKHFEDKGYSTNMCKLTSFWGKTYKVFGGNLDLGVTMVVATKNLRAGSTGCAWTKPVFKEIPFGKLRAANKGAVGCKITVWKGEKKGTVSFYNCHNSSKSLKENEEDLTKLLEWTNDDSVLKTENQILMGDLNFRVKDTTEKFKKGWMNETRDDDCAPGKTSAQLQEAVEEIIYKPLLACAKVDITGDLSEKELLEKLYELTKRTDVNYNEVLEKLYKNFFDLLDENNWKWGNATLPTYPVSERKDQYSAGVLDEKNKYTRCRTLSYTDWILQQGSDLSLVDDTLQALYRIKGSDHVPVVGKYTLGLKEEVKQISGMHEVSSPNSHPQMVQ